MKQTVLICLSMLCTCLGWGQQLVPLHKPVCSLPIVWSHEEQIKVPPPRTVHHVHPRSANFVVNYLPSGTQNGPMPGDTCESWDANAMTAFSYAADIWGGILSSPVDIVVDACWRELPAGTAGSAGPLLANIGPPGDTALYPLALLNAQVGFDLLTSSPDIRATFNSQADWYFGTDMNPSGALVDFVSVVLHELGHGLGFLGSADTADMGTSVYGQLSNPPIISDFSFADGNGMPITDYVSPSAALYNTLLGGSNGLFFTGPNTVACYGGNVPMYAPGTWNSGSSYSHFDENTAATANELMSPSITTGQAIHDPGLATKFLQDIGWELMPLPVDLVSFAGRKVNDQVKLTWTSANEINIERYIVQRSHDLESWETVKTISATAQEQRLKQYSIYDERPMPGNNLYRLKIIHTDEAYEYSQVIEVRFDETARAFALYPNPVAHTLTIEGVADAMEIRLISTDGRLLKERYVADAQYALDMHDLAPGMYYVEIRSGGHVERNAVVKSLR